MRLLALTGVLVTALVGAGSAAAAEWPGFPAPSQGPAFDASGNLTTTGWNTLQGPQLGQIESDKWVGLHATRRDLAIAELERAKRRGRILPRATAIGKFTVTSALLSIGASWGLTGYDPTEMPIYRLITGNVGQVVAQAADVSKFQWCRLGSSEDIGSILTVLRNETGATDAEPIWYYRYNNSTGDITRSCAEHTPTSGAWQARFYDCGSAPTETPCTTDTLQRQTWYAMVDVLQEVPAAITYEYDVSSNVPRVFLTLTDQQYDDLLDSKPITQGEYDALSDKIALGTYAKPTFTEGDQTNANTQLIENTQADTDARTFINYEVDPDWTPEEGDGLVPLLAPAVNETHDAYVARLRSAGWLGTLELVELSEAAADPTVGPAGVVRVRILSETGVIEQTITRPWPAPSPRITAETTLRLITNPATVPPVAGGTGTTTVTGSPTTIPSAPAVDFGPITGLDPGCKFPYGFICYAVDFTDQFSVTADAPRFEFTLGWTGNVNGQAEGGEAPYVVDLEVMDDYMALWRGILTVVLWVGAIYLVATRMLGFRSGGDPGEAIDDVL